MTDYRMTTDDRTAQVSWLRELAANIAENLGEGTAEELVEFALESDTMETWGIEIPEWFDDADRELLVRMMEESL